MKKIIRSWALWLFLVAACSPATPAPNLISDEALATNTSVAPVAHVTLVSDLVPGQTYQEPGLGYAFDYPEAWHIIALPEVPGSTVTITSWDPDNLSGERPQGEGIPEGGEKMDVIPLTDYGVDFEQALPWFREGNADHEFTEESVTLPTGAPGILIRFEQVPGEVGARCLLTEVNETAILLCGAAWDFKFFEPIAFSVRSIQ